MSDRLWLMYFKAIPTPKPRTLKQNAQEAQILITEIPVITVITITAIIVITIAVITATITIAIIAITITTKKAKGKVTGKVKRRALFLKRWYKRFSHLNYANVK
jgi:hypothetical protein